MASVPPQRPVPAASSRDDAPAAYSRELAETLDSLTPEQRRAFDELAELDRRRRGARLVDVIPAVDARQGDAASNFSSHSTHRIASSGLPHTFAPHSGHVYLTLFFSLFGFFVPAGSSHDHGSV